MSNRRVFVCVHGVDYFVDPRMNREQAIADFKEYAERQKIKAEEWLALNDKDITVFSCNGVHVQRNRKILTPKASPTQTEHR